MSAAPSAGPVIEAARAENRAALVGYLPAGFPSVKESAELLRVLFASGADIVEVGLPYSDPVMDGPTIQAAAQRALEAGTRTTDVLRVVENVAPLGPALVMTYWNQVERYGVDSFATDLAAAGGAGLITPDLIPEEAGQWIEAADRHDLDKVFLVAPSSTQQRLDETAAECRGFVYATSVMGVTGARELSSPAAPGLVQRLRKVTEKPIGVGLGVSTENQAADVARYADAVIVGSALVRCVLEAHDLRSATRMLSDLVSALADGVRRGR